VSKQQTMQNDQQDDDSHQDKQLKSSSKSEMITNNALRIAHELVYHEPQ